MKKPILILLLLLLSVPAFAQTYTRLGASQVIYTSDNQPDTKAFLTVFKVIYAGRPVSLTPKTYRTDSSGYLLGDDGARGIRLIAGAQVWLYSPITIVPGISRNPNSGTQYTVPASSATQLEELIYDLTLFGSKGSSLWGTSSGKPSTLAAGTDGYILQADSTQTLGVKWAAFTPSLFGTQSANRVLAGPTTGSATNATFRALVAGDIPDLSATYAATNHTHTLSNLTQSGATTGQYAQWNGSAWVPATVNSAVWGAITGTLSSQTDLQSALDAKQALATALTQISGLSPVNDDIIQRKAGVWTNRTVAQFKSDLGLATVATSGSASDLSTGTLPLARLSGITNTEISASAAIAYSKLNLTGAILNADLAGSIANNKLANSAITIAGTPTSLGSSITASAILDSLGSTQGQILYRGASGWAVLNPGTSGQVLQSGGAAANPSWTSAGGGMSIGGTVTSGTTGSVLFVGASGVLAQDSAAFSWDATNKRLGIGTNTPSHSIDTTGSIRVGANGQVLALSGNMVIGGTANNIYLDVVTGGTINMRVNSVTQLSVDAGSTINIVKRYVNFDTNAQVSSLGNMQIGTSASNLYLDSAAAGSIFLRPGLNTAIALPASGLVGINSTSPAAQLDVRPSSSSTVGQIIRLASGQTANALNIENSTGTLLSGVLASGAFYSAGIAFASLGTPSNGTFVFCTDCTIANPCASGGTGALAKRLNSVWVCN